MIQHYYSLEFKLRAVKEYKENNESMSDYVARIGVSKHAFTDWLKKYGTDPELIVLDETSEVSGNLNTEERISPPGLEAKQSSYYFVQVNNFKVFFPPSHLNQVIKDLKK